MIRKIDEGQLDIYKLLGDQKVCTDIIVWLEKRCPKEDSSCSDFKFAINQNTIHSQ